MSHGVCKVGGEHKDEERVEYIHLDLCRRFPVSHVKYMKQDWEGFERTSFLSECHAAIICLLFAVVPRRDS